MPTTQPMSLKSMLELFRIFRAKMIIFRNSLKADFRGLQTRKIDDGQGRELQGHSKYP